jgi:hypothetical protein
MAVLLLKVCLASSCEWVDPQLEEMPTITCLVLGQPLAAAYQQEHPKVRISGWRCEVRGREKQT